MSSTDSDDQKAPVALVWNEGGKLRLNPEGLEVLRAETRPVVVVAIAGPARMGKSYLLNRIAGRVPGFPVGVTVQSHTKGIWVWNLPHPERSDQRILLLDTEGIGDIEKGDEANDNHIFALLILLSSMFMYNTKAQIDQASLTNLLIVSKLVDLIQVKSGKGNDCQKFVRFFPDFVWVLRDLTLDLEINGEAVSADQYLDNALKLRKGDSKWDNDFNNLRRSLREFFPSRRCFALVTPVNRKHLKRLQEVKDEELDPDFVQEFTRFSNFIHQEGKVKTISGGLQVTGQRLAHMLETYMEAIENGTLPCIETAVQQMTEIENGRAMEKALELYDEKLARIKDISPQLVSDLRGYHTEAIEEFLKHSTRHKNGHLIKLEETLKTRDKDLLEKLNSESTQRCQDTLAKFNWNLQDKLDSSYYMKSGGFAELQTDVEEVEKMFRSVSEKEPMAGNIVENFLKEMKSKLNDVKEIDSVFSVKEQENNVLSEQLQRVEEERKRDEQQKLLEMKVQEEFKENTGKHFKELQSVKGSKDRERHRYPAEGPEQDEETVWQRIQNYSFWPYAIFIGIFAFLINFFSKGRDPSPV